MSQKTILINNVEIFNGKDKRTLKGNVLIENNLITKISSSPIATDKSGTVTIIDGDGKFLMPGLIDNHWHSYMCCNTMEDLMTADYGYTELVAGKEAGKTLLRGFTTIRDLGGPAFGLKRAIDSGVISGPRMYPSGAMISQTAGHGDFRTINEKPQSMGGVVSYPEKIGATTIADGKDAVLAATRDNLRMGATQIKIMGGGGVSSVYDPLDVAEYTEEELKAAVDAAEDWGTYVCTHMYNSRSVRKALEAGVKVIEHGHLMDEQTVKLLAEKGAWLSMQPLGPETPDFMSADQKQKKKDVSAGGDNIYKWSKKYNVKLAWGSDLLLDPSATKMQNSFVVKLKQWFSPYEILKMVTSDNAQLLLLSGKRNPYKEGRLGVVEEGAYADLIIIDGNPLQNIDILEQYDEKFQVIVKDGIIYKNTLLK